MFEGLIALGIDVVYGGPLEYMDWPCEAPTDAPQPLLLEPE